jgi:ketosteroid isomerase-like protein
MTEQENIDLARKGYQEFIEGDINSILNRNTEDSVWFFPGPTDLVPFSGTFQGRDQVAQFFSKLGETLAFDSFEPREFLPFGDRVIVIGHDSGKIRATGTAIEEDWVHICTYRDGKLARWQAFADTGDLVADLIRAKTQVVT